MTTSSAFLLYLSLKVTILFAVYLEAWGARLLVRKKKRRVSRGKMLVIRKGGLEAPERMGGVNNMWAFGNQHKRMRDNAQPDAGNPKNLNGKSGYKKSIPKEKRKQKSLEIFFLCDDAGSWSK